MGRRLNLDEIIDSEIEHDIENDAENNIDLPDDVEGGPYRPPPEDFIPHPPKPLGPLNKWPRSQAAAPAIFFWILFWMISFLYWQDRGDFAVSGHLVFEKGEWWRLASALFTHSGVSHLLANSPMFLVFGMLLGNFFGWKIFPLAVFVVGIISNLLTVYFQDYSIRLVGASGMVYGMVAMWLVYYFHFDNQYHWPIRLSRVIAFSLVVMYPSTYEPNISYLAHGFGFLTGGLFAMVSLPFLKVRE